MPHLLLAFLLALAASAPMAALAATDGIFVESTPADSGSESVPYDSEYAQAARELGLANDTPEADARPGPYYFLEGAHAFRKKEYTFAIQMYQVAASWAYKPAEYNLAVMYARGQGVEVDLPRALAWMALAAERNEKHYVDAREAIYAAMTPQQFEQANAIWRDLKKTYGDGVALRRAKARWAEVRSHMTGSRVGSIGNLSVGTPMADGGPSAGPRVKNHPAKGPAAADSNPNGGPSTAAQILGGAGIDGAVAYGQLRASDNPYDPKFKSAFGTATVGPPAAVDRKSAKKQPAEAPPDGSGQE